MLDDPAVVAVVADAVAGVVVVINVLVFVATSLLLDKRLFLEDFS